MTDLLTRSHTLHLALTTSLLLCTLLVARPVSAQSEIELTQSGTIVARVPNPNGGGNKNIEVIRDGDIPAPGTGQSTRCFDTFLSSDSNRPDDWIGYVYGQQHTFTRVLFQEGRHFSDGGWFTTLTVQVRNNGVWSNVTGLASAPSYPGINNSLTFESYDLSFNPVLGDGIRIYGDPGGAANFITVGELQIFATDAPPALDSCGDANNDDAVTAPDGLIVLRRSVDGTTFCPPNRCDSDGNGSITASDAFLVLEASVGLSVTLQCPPVTGVLFSIAGTQTFGALQLDVDFSAMPGDLVGNGASVNCQSLVSGATTVFNRTGSRLRMSFAAPNGFTGPSDLAYCDATQPENVSAGDFVITVDDAVDDNGAPVSAFVIAEPF